MGEIHSIFDQSADKWVFCICNAVWWAFDKDEMWDSTCKTISEEVKRTYDRLGAKIIKVYLLEYSKHH